MQDGKEDGNSKINRKRKSKIVAARGRGAYACVYVFAGEMGGTRKLKIIKGKRKK